MNAATRILPTVGWGIFCASSWTWCIGMFLPIILLRDHGWIGFLAFAVPNVIGCSAFGYVMSRRRAESSLRENAPSVRLFSFVTVAYQLFFVGFVLAALAPAATSPTAIGILVLLVAEFLGGRAARASRPAGDGGRVPWPTLMLLGVVVWLGSMALIAVFGVGGWSDFGVGGSLPRTEIWWLLPLMAFGFLLCPYLDGTFHVARIHAPSRHAFAIFGLTFAAMILFSAAYASTLLRDGLVWPIVVHMLIQATFTCAVHMRVLNDLRPRTHRMSIAPWLGWLAAPLAGALLVRFAGGDATAPSIAGEAWYLRWLAFYGIVFPAMVLLLRRAAAGDPTRRLVPMAIVVALGLLIAELGVIHGHRWLVPLPIVAALLVGLWPGGSRPVPAIHAS